MLHKLQHSFMQAIYQQQHELNHLLANHQRSASHQIEIYRNSIFGGLLKSLSEIYPVTRRLVGKDFFDALCLRYIARTPSTRPDINFYGQTLADFTAGFPPAMSLPYLADVMRLEWAWHWALQSNDSETSNLATLTRMDGETLANVVLILPDSATLVTSAFPVLTIWQANQPEQDNDTPIDLNQGSQDILVWRNKLQLCMDLLDSGMVDFLQAILHQQTLAEMQSLTEFNSYLITTLQNGYISHFQIKNDSIVI